MAGFYLMVGEGLLTTGLHHLDLDTLFPLTKEYQSLIFCFGKKSLVERKESVFIN